MKKFISVLDQAQRILAGLSIFLLSVFIILDILGRKFSLKAFPGHKKLSVYLMIWADFWVHLLRIIKELTFDLKLLISYGGESMKGVFHRVRHGITSIFCFMASWYSYKYVQESVEFGDTTPILNDFPLWIVQVIIPLSFLLMGVTSLIYSINEKIAPNQKREIH